MSELQKMLKEAERKKRNSANQKLILQDVQVGELGPEVEDLKEGAEQIRQAIVALKADKKVFSRQSSKLKEQLQESKRTLQMFSEEMAAREKGLEELNRTYQILGEQFKVESQGTAVRVDSLEKEIEDLKAGYQERVQSLEEDKILKGPTKELLNRMARKLFEQSLTRACAIHLKVICPQCKEDISGRFRLRLKSKERDATGLLAANAEEYCGTWVNKDYNAYREKRAVLTLKPDGRFAHYDKESDAQPHSEGRVTIKERWTDSNGNIWYKVTLSPDLLGHTKYRIMKLSDSGKVLEYVWSPSEVPTKVDLNSPNYRILYRK
jgi:hypothetical protein